MSRVRLLLRHVFLNGLDRPYLKNILRIYEYTNICHILTVLRSVVAEVNVGTGTKGGRGV